MDKLIEKMANFVYNLSYSDLDSDVIKMAKDLILHHLHTGYSGFEEAESKVAIFLLENENLSGGKSTVLGMNKKYPIRKAAFANAVMMHSIQQEDTYRGLHPGPHTIPAAFSLAENFPRSGKEVLTAIVAGYEINIRLGEVCASYTSPRGWRGTTIFGVIGVAATAAKILGLSLEETINALAMAANTSSGLMQCWLSGTDEWLYASGLASSNGILSAQLAKESIRGASDTFEGDRGFFKAYCGEPPENLYPITTELGKEFAILMMIMKPYSVITTILPVIHNVLTLIRRDDIQHQEIETVKIIAGPRVTRGPLKSSILDEGPYVNKTQAFKSLPCAVGIALKYMEVTAATANNFDDAKVAQLAERVAIETKEDADGFYNEVVINTVNSKKHSISGEDFPTLSSEQVRKNLRSSASKFISSDQVEALIRSIDEIDKMEMEDISNNLS